MLSLVFRGRYCKLFQGLYIGMPDWSTPLIDWVYPTTVPVTKTTGSPRAVAAEKLQEKRKVYCTRVIDALGAMAQTIGIATDADDDGINDHDDHDGAHLASRARSRRRCALVF